MDYSARPNVFKKTVHGKMGYPVSLDTLPEDICLLICSKVAAESIKEFHTLKLVSKTFERLCDDPIVLRRVPIGPGSPFFPGLGYSHHLLKYLDFLDRCYEKNHPAAVYRVGFVQYFRDQQTEGLQRIAFAAREGFNEAQYFYGIILLCLGGEGKVQGFQYLTDLRKTLADYSEYWLDEDNSDNYLFTIEWYAGPMIKRLKRTYARDKCKCDGVKEGLYENPDPLWERYSRLEDSRKKIASLSCQICYCHLILQLFFDATEP